MTDQDHADDGQLPPWAYRRAKSYFDIGAVLYTRDGRRSDNVTVVSVSRSERHGRVAVLRTDAGDSVNMSEREVISAFHPPKWVRALHPQVGGLSDEAIREADIISPFCERTLHEKTGMSYGLGSSSYDVRIKDTTLLLPWGFRLAVTIERFTMPHNVLGVVHDKSTLARRGVSLFNTYIDPGWSGYLTVEISNRTLIPRLLVAGQPIAQIVFYFTDRPVSRPYSGKYNNQDAIPVPAIFEKRDQLPHQYGR